MNATPVYPFHVIGEGGEQRPAVECFISCKPTKRNFDSKSDQLNSEEMILQKKRILKGIEHGNSLINDPQNEYNGKLKLCGLTFTKL